MHYFLRNETKDLGLAIKLLVLKLGLNTGYKFEG